jgi:hypothetical protein
VSRAMKQLVAKGYIVTGPKIGTVTTLRLSDRLAWRGTVKNLNAYRMSRIKELGARPHVVRP